MPIRRYAVQFTMEFADHPNDVSLDAMFPRDMTSVNWMGLRWSAWMPLMAAHPLALAQLPSEPGIYRIRRADVPDRLQWIGRAEEGVRETVERLSRQVHMPVAPYNDPRTPALELWRIKQEQAACFEVSGVGSVEAMTEEALSGICAASKLSAHAALRNTD